MVLTKCTSIKHMWRLRTLRIVACLALPGWGWTLISPKKLIFARFYIIKSNWKSSFLFLVFISSCLLLPDPSLGQMKKCTTSLYSWPYWWPYCVCFFLHLASYNCTTSLYSWPYWWAYWVCFFLHLASYNNILCISRPMALTKCTSIKHMWRLRTLRIVVCLALPAWGGPLWTPKKYFFARFYIININWKSSSLFCLLILLGCCCRTLPWDKWKKCTTSLFRDLIGDLTGSVSFCT